MDCVENLLKALQIYSQTESTENEKQVEYLNAIKQKLVKTDSNVLLSAVSELAKVTIFTCLKRFKTLKIILNILLLKHESFYVNKCQLESN